MDASSDEILSGYLDARLAVSRHLDDPEPVAAAWSALRALEWMLLRRGWSGRDLDDAYARHERAYLHALDAAGWRAHLVEALTHSTDRSLRIAQALARYHEQTGGVAD